jgi:hypothetical protein
MCDRKNNKIKINHLLNIGATPTQDEEQVPHDAGMNQGEHMKKRIKRRKYNMHLQLKSGPPSKGIIQWIRFWVT